VDVYSIVGLIGSCLYLTSYFLLVKKKIDGNGFKYIAMNGLAACLVLVSLTEHYNLPSVIIQVAWMIISFFGLYKLWKNNGWKII